MSRYYSKSLALIIFTLVSYLITRLLSPGTNETDQIARRLQIQQVQGNVVIHRPETEEGIPGGNPASPGGADPRNPREPLKIKLPTTRALHPGHKEDIVNITCTDNHRADVFEKNLRPKAEDARQRRLPRALVIGAKKSGTGALMHFMGMHPNVSGDWGEAHYFDDDALYNAGLRQYWRLMPLSLPTQITIEKTPIYFVDPKVPPRVKCFNPRIKLILILKDPVDRLVSDYVHERFHGLKLNTTLPENRHSFEQLVLNKKTGEINTDYAPVRVGDYHLHLERWLRYFPRKQILVLDGEAFLKNPVRSLVQVEQFLEIPPYFALPATAKLLKFDMTRGYFCLTRDPRKGGKCLAEDKGRRHTYPEVSKDVLTKLAYYYRPHNEQLFQIIGQTFSWK